MSQKNLTSLPVYGKALELCNMSREIASYVSFNKDLLKLYQSKSLRDHIADALLTDAILIPQQIAQAEQASSYRERMRRASFIGIMIRNINSYCTGLEKDGVREKEYLDLLRAEIKSFRSSFKKWRKALSGDSRQG
ncbi:TIGR03643 family protein [Flavobacteriaceae bacterium TP-CH-4]|uniref:TIGR03643 family protein n=2 Tax=Pelagihabitans pacificus TaxID=2696054 RepID=A0A967E412_9FLAO|nr:TIGR03643 family protein [Pelagihabitans pacificus]